MHGCYTGLLVGDGVAVYLTIAGSSESCQLIRVACLEARDCRVINAILLCYLALVSHAVQGGHDLWLVAF